MNFITIPVRLASSRFPDKVIQDLHGKPLMQWIWEACSQVVGSDSVYFNTPDSKLVAIAESFGAQAVLTDTYNCVLDQCSEATRKIKEFLPFYDTVTVVQGDEPMTTPEMIWKSIIGYYNSDCAGSCLYKKITLEEAKDINTVKCVLSEEAGERTFRYLSRSIVPGTTPEKYGRGITEFYKQVCVFTFSVSTLSSWWSNTPMDSVEASEGIDLIRFTQRGKRIVAIESFEDTQAVDTPEDLEKVRELTKDVQKSK